MVSVRFEKMSFGYASSARLFERLDLCLGGPTGQTNRGRLVAIMGPSGSGKTTLLRLVAGVERPDEGAVRTHPTDASASYLQQEPVLFEHLSAEANARYFQTVESKYAHFDEDVFGAVSQSLGLVDLIRRQQGVQQLSGGERQRLSLLRAMSVRPRVLLLDEPGNGLDVEVKVEFLHMLRQVVDDFAVLALYVTHHVDEAELVADDLLYLPGRGGAPTGRAATLLSIDSALGAPPSVDAARSLLKRAVNCITVRVDRHGTLFDATGRPLGRVTGSPVPSGACQALFPPETVRWLESREGVVRAVGGSARHTFARLQDGQPLIGPRADAAALSFTLQGEAVLFPVETGPGVTVSLSAPLDLQSADS